MRVFALAFNIALGIVVIAWLHSPPLGYQSHTRQSQPQATVGQHGVPGGPVANSFADEQSGKGDKKKDWIDYFLDHLPDWFVAAFTGLLVYVTYRLVVTTGDLVQADRPRMLMDQLKVSGTRAAPELDGNVRLPVTYRLKNFGRSPASITRISILMRLDADVPPTPDYGNITAVRHVVTPSGWYGTQKPYVSGATPDEVRDVLAGTKSIFFFGFVEYKGLGGVKHRFRFCYRTHFGDGEESEMFSPAGPDSYWEDT